MAPRRGQSIPPSIPVGPGVLARAFDLLARVETLPADAAGSLCFAGQGVLLVEDGAVCWAAAPGMRPRFTQILRYEHDPPLAREILLEVYRQCRDDQAPVVNALLASGKVSEAGLKTALFEHIAEAVAHLALSGARYVGFLPHARYDARFAFAPARILACLGARADPALADEAERALERTLVPDTSGWAFLRDGGLGAPVVVAVRGAPAVRGEEMLEIGAWTLGLFDVTGVFDADVRVASASFGEGRYVVAWRDSRTYFAAKCANRAGAARLVAALDQKLAAGDAR
ncbi:MAG TPA: hypothetical protein VGQ57_08840 [Polyangiaceae bacterium]|jgi:hypothetical protein|nr:hypothetical protein [Polyangiaceae bacterium]